MLVNGILAIQMLSIFPTTKRDYIIELFLKLTCSLCGKNR